MRQYIWGATLLGCFATLCTMGESRNLVKRDASQDAINPGLQHVDSDDQFRDKRKVDAAFGVKNAVLGFVFNPKSSRFAWDKPSTTPRGPTTTEDIVIYEKGEKVELQVPDELFGSGFTLLTNVSSTVGDFMMNSAIRTQRVLEAMRPFLRGLFGVKGFVIEGPTDKPIFTDSNST